MKNKPWKFKAAGRGSLTIELLEQIGEDFFSEGGTTAKSFSEELAAAGPGITSIKLRISSPGGNVWQGLAIHDQLIRHRAKVTAEVMFAASIASVIAMAADTVSMTPSGVMMVHLPHTLVSGSAPDLRKMASALDTVTQAMIKAYQRKTPKSAKEIEDLLAAETWMTAAEAVQNGFADEVLDPDQEENEDLAAAFAAPIFAKFHPPARIAARYAGHDDDERRRRSRLRTIELHEMFEANSRHYRDETRALQLSNMRAADAAKPVISDDLRRRRIMAQRDKEIRAMRLAELGARGGGSVDEGRRRIMAEHEKEVARYAPAVFKWPGMS